MKKTNKIGKEMLDFVKFFRRRQFVLGPEFYHYNGWQRLNLFDKYKLTLHPDLAISYIKYSHNEAILLGYAIDPYQPKLCNEEVLKRFVEGEVELKNIFMGLEALTGRFVLIINCGSGTWLFHDACGLRQVNYFKDNNGHIWCASQAETIAERFDLNYDEEVIKFRNCPEYRKTKEDFALINDRSPYREIKYLLANHYLDLRKGKAVRFWPTERAIGSISVRKSIELIKPILTNSIEAAANRYDLRMGITAGCDSRKSLAAAKKVKNKIYFYTHTPQKTKEVDIEIPEKLLPKLGIIHHKLDLLKMDKEFESLYGSSATWARERHGDIAYTTLKFFGSESVILNSNISEYSQISYWLPKSRINGEGLALLKSLNSKLAIRDYEEWLDSAYFKCSEANMNILVFFQLELRSRWVANTFSECDIAYESFNPYNNRRLYRLELAVNERLRRGVHKLDFSKKLIKSMWPEVLQEPINPEKTLDRKLKKVIIEKIIHKGISPWIPLIEYLKYRELKKLYKKRVYL